MDDDLLVDLRSRAAKPSTQDVDVWASQQRVFVSSVMHELVEERKAVAQAVRSFGAVPVWFEEFGPRDADAEDAYLGEVRSSTIYVGILGHSYGKVLKASRLSATHVEYRAAEREGLRVCAWTAAAADWLGDQQAFIDEIRTFHVTNSFESPDHLATSVSQRLAVLAAEDLSPWCKIGRVVVRATRIEDTGKEVVITATIYDPAVLSALEDMRPSMPTWWSSNDKRITYAGRSRLADLREVTTSIESARATRVQVTLVPSDTPATDRPTYVTLGSEQFSADDLIEINVRKAAFGVQGPKGVQILGGTLKDPLNALRKLAPPDEVLRALAHLLWTEALVGPGQASQVTRVLLSQQINGHRQMLVEWQPNGKNSEGLRSVQGNVPL